MDLLSDDLARTVLSFPDTPNLSCMAQCSIRFNRLAAEALEARFTAVERARAPMQPEESRWRALQRLHKFSLPLVFARTDPDAICISDFTLGFVPNHRGSDPKSSPSSRSGHWSYVSHVGPVAQGISRPWLRGEDGTGDERHATVVCGLKVRHNVWTEATMHSGVHHANFVVGDCYEMVGIVHEDFDGYDDYFSASRLGWAWEPFRGCLCTDGEMTDWPGQTGYKWGDTVGLKLDLGDGTLTAFKNGVELGTMLSGLQGGFCFAVQMLWPAAICSVAWAPLKLQHQRHSGISVDYDWQEEEEEEEEEG